MFTTLLLSLEVLATLGSFPPEGLAPRIAVNPEWFVHAVPIRDREVRTGVLRGWEIVRTDRVSGAMTILFQSGIFEFPTRRVSFRERRLLGTCTAANSLVTLEWVSGRLWDRPRVGRSLLESGALTIVIRDLRAGGATRRYRWVEASGRGASSPVPRERALLGPISIDEGRIHVFGVPAPDEIPRLEDC